MSYIDETDDDELRDALREIDLSEDHDVTPWEADFLESVVYRHPNRPLTNRQRKTAKIMIRRYPI